MKTSFQADIFPLFRQKDIDSMKAFGQFDLSQYADVADHADDILTHLQRGDMPCDGAWPPEKVALFSKWIADGKLA